MDLNEGQYTVKLNESANNLFYPKHSSHGQVSVVVFLPKVFFSFAYASLVEFDIGLSSPFDSVLVCCPLSFLICQNETKKEQNFHPSFRTNFE